MFHALILAKVCGNFQIDMLKYAVEIQEKLIRQSLLFHPVLVTFSTESCLERKTFWNDLKYNKSP